MQHKLTEVDERILRFKAQAKDAQEKHKAELEELLRQKNEEKIKINIASLNDNPTEFYNRNSKRKKIIRTDPE